MPRNTEVVNSINCRENLYCRIYTSLTDFKDCKNNSDIKYGFMYPSLKFNLLCAIT